MYIYIYMYMHAMYNNIHIYIYIYMHTYIHTHAYSPWSRRRLHSAPGSATAPSGRRCTLNYIKLA